jgi:hypothetical protein
MREPREGEVVTDASLVGALRVAAQGGTPPSARGPVIYEVRVGSAVAHATVTGSEISVNPGGHPTPDLVAVGGPGFRDVLAGVLDPDAALAAGAVEFMGDRSLLADFLRPMIPSTNRSVYVQGVVRDGKFARSGSRVGRGRARSGRSRGGDGA